MSALQNRAKAIVSRLGESFTVGAVAHNGVFSVLPWLRALGYLTQAEVDASKRPMHTIVTSSDDTCAVGDSFTRNGHTLTIRSIALIRIRGETIAKVLAATAS